ncbi:type II secretion system major pseudopilin GspG [Variovorax humicola]|uniref:Type II secretion system core protein G n=1 Tax=Variovorax humicola TaxID=1769758 RepID=A0ABU8VSW1_9BURK
MIYRQYRSGFTLLELLVVLLIIALLAGYVGPKLFGEVDKAKIKSAAAQMKTLGDALDHYRLDLGNYPTTDQGLRGLVIKPDGASSKWQGPYLAKEIPRDPWDHAYVYRKPGTGGKDYDLLSYGADGKEGGSGIDADIAF